MLKILLIVSTSALCLPSVAGAAVLRPFTQIAASTVRLADLFGELGATPDRVLGPAPAPGARILVGAPQLAAIARDFNVDWRPASGEEQAVVERRGDPLPKTAVMAALRTALQAAGAPEGSDIAMPDIQPVTVPVGSALIPEVSQCSYDPSGGHFTALISVGSPEMEPVRMRVSGAVIVLVQAAVAEHRMVRGAEVASEDVKPMRVRVGLLHGNAPIQMTQAVGMVLKHDVAPGQPLTTLDLARPDLVLRGSLVRMTLHSEGIALAAEGIARESGARGDRVLVENPTSHAMVEADVTGPNEVRVAPRGTPISLVSAQ